ncbi:hypothetical protein [Streptomyces inhibens]|uniref:hypothetical protein n=1 Tax=Streptomyces inhibens TaxID=2293571 RepID=UPI001EE72255|nr:hypothetical protein [Streptomyces inhibens]UKY47581.1 hypothetical protein KI385_01125 [Streptomyces inhibens]
MWYDALHRILQELNDLLFDTSMWELITGIGDAGLIGYVVEVVELGIFLMDHLRNEDDLSCCRGLFMDQYELVILSHRGTSDYHFNGDAHHVLKVKSTGEEVPFPTGTLEYVVRTGDTWGVPIAMEWESMTPPALASYNGKLYAAFVRPGEKAVMWTRLEGQVWSSPQALSGDHSYYAPALAVGLGKLFYAFTGGDGGLYWRTCTESGGWTDRG